MKRSDTTQARVENDVACHPGSTASEISERTGIVRYRVESALSSAFKRGLMTRTESRHNRRYTRR